MSELLHGKQLEDQSEEIQKNLSDLLVKINRVRELWAKPMRVTSGLRAMEDHLRIYREKGITDPDKIPMKSRHLFGMACDIFDPKKELQQWCLANEPILAEIGLWMEDFSATPNWVHFQIVPPRSGNRFFKP